MSNDSIASNEPNLNAFYKTPQYCLAINRAHAEFLQWQDKPGGLVVAKAMAFEASHWANVLLPEAKRLNISMLTFRLWHKGIVEARGLDGEMGESAWLAFHTVDQLWSEVEAELERLREAAISEAKGEADRPPMKPLAALIYEELLTLPEHRAMTLPDILTWLGRAHGGKIISDDHFHKELRPELEGYGMKNRAKIGYYIPTSARPTK